MIMKRQFIHIAAAICLLCCTLATPDTAVASTNVTYIIPIKGMIERGLVYVIRRGVAQARRDNAAAIIFDMDTPGGRLDAAEEIVHTIGGIKIKTVTYVNPDAISAGAIIAMATDEIYMAPGSRIGDAMPIMLSPIGGAQEMSEGVEEKSVSYVASVIRSAAQRKGHDAKLAESMVRREVEYRIGDEIICPEGELLTLTNVEAERIVEEDGVERLLLSSGTVGDLDELLETLGLDNSETVELLITPAEKVARYIEMLSVVLLAGGILGLYIEFKTPGFGIPGIVGILLLVVWFWGHHVAGLAGSGELVVFAAGALLLAVEILIIPGFGAIGLAGICLMIISVAMAMIQHYPGLPVFPPGQVQFTKAMEKLGMSLTLSFLVAVFLARFLPRTHVFQRLMLGASVGSDEGYVASHETDDLLGMVGTAETPLRPGGIGLFGNKRLDVVTRGDFINDGESIVVAETHGNRIVVETSTERC